MKTVNYKLYFVTLLITIALFSAALISSNYINKKRTDELKAAENKLSLDILSLETQYDLLEESSCDTYKKNGLGDEMEDLASRLSFMEQQVGADDPEVFRLKRYYSLIEIKDYLLAKKVSAECKYNTIFILYFYSNKNCSQCLTQEYMLRAIHNEYPQTKIYSFDYDLDLPAIQTLITLHNIPRTPPVIDINGKAYAAFPTLNDMRAIIEPLATTTSTTTQPSRNASAGKVKQ